MDIFVVLFVLALFGVNNLTSQMRVYHKENKTRMKQSYKYRHHCARPEMTRLQKQTKQIGHGSNQVIYY